MSPFFNSEFIRLFYIKKVVVTKFYQLPPYRFLYPLTSEYKKFNFIFNLIINNFYKSNECYVQSVYSYLQPPLHVTLDVSIESSNLIKHEFNFFASSSFIFVNNNYWRILFEFCSNLLIFNCQFVILFIRIIFSNTRTVDYIWLMILHHTNSYLSKKLRFKLSRLRRRMLFKLRYSRVDVLKKKNWLNTTLLNFTLIGSILRLCLMTSELGIFFTHMLYFRLILFLTHIFSDICVCLFFSNSFWFFSEYNKYVDNLNINKFPIINEYSLIINNSLSLRSVDICFNGFFQDYICVDNRHKVLDFICKEFSLHRVFNFICPTTNSFKDTDNWLNWYKGRLKSLYFINKALPFLMGLNFYLNIWSNRYLFILYWLYLYLNIYVFSDERSNCRFMHNTQNISLSLDYKFDINMYKFNKKIKSSDFKKVLRYLFLFIIKKVSGVFISKYFSYNFLQLHDISLSPLEYLIKFESSAYFNKILSYSQYLRCLIKYKKKYIWILPINKY